MKTLSGMQQITKTDLPQLQEEIAKAIDEKLNGTDQTQEPFWRWQLIAVPRERPTKREEFLVVLAGNQNPEGAVQILEGGLEILKHEKTKATYVEEGTVHGKSDRGNGSGNESGD